jgi:hypothetical protein
MNELIEMGKRVGRGISVQEIEELVREHALLDPEQNFRAIIDSEEDAVLGAIGVFLEIMARWI